MALDVLIVDDSAAIRKILQRVLMQAEVPLGTVHEANDGQEALAKLNGEKVGLILSDIYMPNMDGIELLGRQGTSESRSRRNRSKRSWPACFRKRRLGVSNDNEYRPKPGGGSDLCGDRGRFLHHAGAVHQTRTGLS